MILGREKELNYLNTTYEKTGSQILVVYGQKNIGKTTLLMEFIKDKDSFYYYATDNSERGQLYLLSKACKSQQIIVPEYPENYEVVWQRLLLGNTKKKVIILDGFEHLVKGSKNFMTSLIEAVKASEQEFMVILCSQSIGFVENDLVSKIGRAALSISGFVKIKELGFYDFRTYFNQYSTEECIILYAILGGIPGLWQYIDQTISLKENICNAILKKGSVLREEGGRIVRDNLREPAVYFSILSALAEDKNKLNDLYLHTEYSRAKISVYIKNLMELEVVTKNYSIDTPGRDNQKKGVYSISNHFVRFWFRYIYPNMSELNCLSPLEFYDQFIEKTLTGFCQEAFSEICRETMNRWNESEAFMDIFEENGCFEGKIGKIDFVGQNDEEDYIVAFSSFQTSRISRLELSTYINIIQSAKIEPIRIYLFARGGFDEEIALWAKTKQDLILIGLQDI